MTQRGLKVLYDVTTRGLDDLSLGGLLGYAYR